MKKEFGLSSFVLKIIALFTMTLDHVGFYLLDYSNYTSKIIGFIFVNIGKICYPIILFCLYQGLKHTSNIKKYLLRLGISSIIITISLIILSLLKIDISNFRNVFISLFMLALFYYFYKNSNKKYLSILPIIYFLIFDILSIVTKNSYIQIINSLYPQFPLTSLMLFIPYVIVSAKTDEKYKEKLSNEEFENFKKTKEYIKSNNVIFIIITLIISLIYFCLTFIENYSTILLPIEDFAIQESMILSALFIYFYNDRKGYSNKKIQYAFYFYYPLHLVIIYLIFTLI